MNTPIAMTLRRVTAAAAIVVVAMAGSASTAVHAAPKGEPAGASKATSLRTPAGYRLKLLAKAVPDECFAGVGQPYPVGMPCQSGTPKVNQAYVWGLTQIGDGIWFGTGANPHCLTSGATLDYLKPTANDNYTCEYGESQPAKNNPQLPPEIGDMRSPEVWVYDKNRRTSTNKSAEVRAKSPQDANRLRTTIGLRAAGSFGNVVLLGGPALNNSINLFAFDAGTRAYLGSTTLSAYGNIRTFLVAEDALYLGVGIGRNGADGGAVLRWTGDSTQPFAFVPVATMPVQAADLALHDGRIAATSWPATQPVTPDRLGGVWISPPLADGAPGLNPEDSTGWRQAWHIRQYEPDRVLAATYGMGGVASHDGYLYWGTMHVPMKGTAVHANIYPPKDAAAAAAMVKNTQRATTIFRGKDLGTPQQKIEVVYGESELPAWDPAGGDDGTGAWSMASTNSTPLYGESGFGNPFNNYTWRMTVSGGQLYIGTMDWSYLVQDLIPEQATEPEVSATARRAMSDRKNLPVFNPLGYGGELWTIPSATEPALAVNTKGLGNHLNYGIRNMIVNGDGLYLGMANPMNLRTDMTDRFPEGGWELMELVRR